MTNARDELLPCPFCGGQAVYDTGTEELFGSERVVCLVCDAQTCWTESDRSKDRKILEWNTRAPAQGAVNCGVSWRDEYYTRARDCMIELLRVNGWTIDAGRNDEKQFDNAFQHAVGILALTASSFPATTTREATGREEIIEECAKLCETLRLGDYSAENSDWAAGTLDCANAIRALVTKPAQDDVRKKTIEECAKIAETGGCGDPKCMSCLGNQIASEIRALVLPSTTCDSEEATRILNLDGAAFPSTEGK